MSTDKIYFRGEIRKPLSGYLFLSGAMNVEIIMGQIMVNLLLYNHSNRYGTFFIQKMLISFLFLNKKKYVVGTH